MATDIEDELMQHDNRPDSPSGSIYPRQATDGSRFAGAVAAMPRGDGVQRSSKRSRLFGRACPQETRACTPKQRCPDHGSCLVDFNGQD
jgi:hypothetical protein